MRISSRELLTYETFSAVRLRAESDAWSRGHFLNPNFDFLNDFLKGLRRNEEWYGYLSGPCRLATGNFDIDRDIICPCDYRDPDCEEYGCCYCALFVAKDAYEGKITLGPVPERRPLEKQAQAYGGDYSNIVEEEPVKVETTVRITSDIKRRLWYCKQCGYVCFRDDYLTSVRYARQKGKYSLRWRNPQKDDFEVA
jgi:ferredoxin-thioredoxin reductase catalytic chain